METVILKCLSLKQKLKFSFLYVPSYTTIYIKITQLRVTV